MKFRLASVLSLREAQLSESSEQVARIETRVLSIEVSRGEVESEREQTQEGVASAESILAADLHVAAVYLTALERESDQLRAEALVVRQTLDSARSDLVERHRAVTVLRRLRERLSSAAVLEATRGEQRALDEVAGVQAYRRKQA